MNAAAVDRLMPAKQWMTSGRVWSQRLDECDQRADMVVGRQDHALGRLDDVVDADEQVVLGRDRVRPRHRRVRR